MQYNAKYDRWFSEDGKIYRQVNQKFIECKQTLCHGYLRFGVKNKMYYSHRAIWETFNGAIPEGYEIDHVKGDRTDNRLDMLRLVTHLENMANPVYRERRAKLNTPHNKSKWSKARIDNHEPFTDFGKKFKEHYNMYQFENKSLYSKEYNWFKRHGFCRWEAK